MNSLFISDYTHLSPGYLIKYPGLGTVWRDMNKANKLWLYGFSRPDVKCVSLISPWSFTSFISLRPQLSTAAQGLLDGRPQFLQKQLAATVEQSMTEDTGVTGNCPYVPTGKATKYVSKKGLLFLSRLPN